MAFIRLSYILDSNIPVYGDFSHPSFPRINDMNQGATANKTAISMDSHMGTHIDFPLHFFADGKAGENYLPEELVFNEVIIAEVRKEGGLISNNDLKKINPDVSVEMLIVKTGFCSKRNEVNYWQGNPGFAAETASFLKQKLPSLRAIGFDSISLSSFQHREEGRKAHREFLSRDILIIEDMDLNTVNEEAKFSKVIVAPMLFKSCDGAPCYILAETIDQ